MKASDRIKAFVKSTEKCWKPVPGRPGFFVAYKPTPQDRWTIGWGSTGLDIHEGCVWEQKTCDARFDADAAVFEAGVTQLVGRSKTTQAQFDAMFSFAYNCGLDIDADLIAEGLGDSTLLKLHKAGDYAGAAKQFLKWDKQKGRVLRGLTTRRKFESRVYLGTEPGWTGK